jgi:hypothetical protein
MRGKIELRTRRNAGVYMNDASSLNSRNSKAIIGGLANVYYPAVRKRR